MKVLNLIMVLNKDLIRVLKVLKGSELYGEATVSLSPYRGGSTPVFSPYTEDS